MKKGVTYLKDDELDEVVQRNENDDNDNEGNNDNVFIRVDNIKVQDGGLDILEPTLNEPPAKDTPKKLLYAKLKPMDMSKEKMSY